MEIEEDAALVDSFFLPGGILDPDDEDDTPVPSIPPFLIPDGGEISRVPSNPWRDDFVNLSTIVSEGSSSPRRASGVGLGSMPTAQDHHLNESTVCHQYPPIIRPPPGYTENDRAVSRMYENENGVARHVSTISQRVERDALNRASFPIINPLFEEGKTSTRSPPLLDRTIQRPEPATSSPWPGSAKQHLEVVQTEESQQQRLKTTTSNTINESAIIIPHRDDIVHDAANEDAFIDSKSSQVLDFSLPTALLCDSSEPPERAQETDFVRSNSSFPLELLSVHGIYSGDSLTSSLSESTCGGSGASATSHASEEKESEEKKGNQADGDRCEEEVVKTNKRKMEECIQERPIENECKQDCNQDVNISPVKLDVVSEPNMQKHSRGRQFQTAIRRVWDVITMLAVSLLRLPGKLMHVATSPVLEIIQRTFLFTQHRIAAASENTGHFITDAKLAVSALLLDLIRRAHDFIASGVVWAKLAISVLIQIWKFSLFEAIEEPNVSICYCIFSFMPQFCFLFMNTFNFPHWTSHLMTAIAVFSLCRQVEAGALYLDAATILSETNKSTTYSKKGAQQLNDELNSAGETHPRDARACKTILHVLKLVLPIFFLIDGFATEFGTVMGVGLKSRLTTAFMMCLVRKNLVSSPIGWMSWAIQVLVATYFPSSGFADHVVLVAGLSSIRLIRYLDFQRLILYEERRSKKNR